MIKQQFTLLEAPDEQAIGDHRYRILNQILADDDVLVFLSHVFCGLLHCEIDDLNNVNNH